MQGATQLLRGRKQARHLLGALAGISAAAAAAAAAVRLSPRSSLPSPCLRHGNYSRHQADCLSFISLPATFESPAHVPEGPVLARRLRGFAFSPLPRPDELAELGRGRRLGLVERQRGSSSGDQPIDSGCPGTCVGEPAGHAVVFAVVRWQPWTGQLTSLDLCCCRERFEAACTGQHVVLCRPDLPVVATAGAETARPDAVSLGLVDLIVLAAVPQRQG
jgi:hypothetical protein